LPTFTEAECRGTAVPHLDEYQRVAVASAAVQHDQVEFAAAIVRVRGDFTQAGAQQGIARGRFGEIAAGSAVGRYALSHRRRSARRVRH
jgi:hypothetical protein